MSERFGKPRGTAGVGFAAMTVVVAAMVERPALLWRPFVVNGERAVLARPIERALDVL